MNCVDCKDTGIWICTLDNTTDVAIQRCDHCGILNNDAEAIRAVEALIYGEAR